MRADETTEINNLTFYITQLKRNLESRTVCLICLSRIVAKRMFFEKICCVFFLLSCLIPEACYSSGNVTCS